MKEYYDLLNFLKDFYNSLNLYYKNLKYLKEFYRFIIFVKIRFKIYLKL